MILPSKKVLSLLLLTVSLVIFTVLVFGKKDTAGKQIIASTLRGGADLELPTNSNWEGVLNEKNENISEATENPSDTDKLSISLISDYLNLKQSGDLDESEMQNLINEANQYTENIITNEKITASDLNVTENNSKQSIEEYGENLGMIFKKNNLAARPQKDIATMKEVLNTQDPEKIEEMENSINYYIKIVEELRQMPVPKTFLIAHLDIVNGIQGLALGLSEVKKVFDDPIRGLQGLSIYQNGGYMLMLSTEASSTFIKSNDITYKQGTGGYYLLYGI